MTGLHIELNEQTHYARGGHPENAARLKPIMQWLQNESQAGRFKSIPVSSHGHDPIYKVHSHRYIDFLIHACESGEGHLDPDTYITPGSFDSAVRVVDAALSAIDQVMSGELNSAFLLVRPPGHHAEHDRAMGFCLLNNVAIAAQYLIDRHGLERVGVIDFDVHHGNGTQHIFYDRQDILFASSHHYPYYPGTGSRAETGTGAGKGFTLNVPLTSGSGDKQILAAFEKEILPALKRFSPQFILVSAGFDAHQLDPIGGLQVTGDGFRQIGKMIRSLAGELCSGRAVSLLEGGYNAEGNLDAISNYLIGMDTI